MNETVMQEPEVATTFNAARQAAELIQVGGSGVEVQNFAQQVDYAKWIAKAGYAIPSHLRDNVGACLAVLDISQRWGFSPYQVARLCYVVNDQLAFMAQLVVAVINKFAPLEGRLRYQYEGEGDERVCIVTGIPKGETEALEYRSPPLGKITPKNSPLWKSDSDQQLGYLAGTRFCRRHFPEILIGIYSPEELFDAAITPHLGAERAKNITPDNPGASLHERLAAAGRGEDGFRDGVVDAGLNGHAPIAPEISTTESNSSPAAPEPQTKPAPEHVSPDVTGAGATSSPDGATALSDGEPKQAGGGGDPAANNSAGLPEDWPAQYAAALTRATKPSMLPKRATEYWNTVGGWEKYKGGPNASTATAIYDAFANNFGPEGEEARETILHELNAN